MFKICGALFMNTNMSRKGEIWLGQRYCVGMYSNMHELALFASFLRSVGLEFLANNVAVQYNQAVNIAKTIWEIQKYDQTWHLILRDQLC